MFGHAHGTTILYYVVSLSDLVHLQGSRQVWTLPPVGMSTLFLALAQPHLIKQS